MASEDSDQLASGRLPVHRFSNFGDLNQARNAQVASVRDQSHATRELLRIAMLGGPKPMDFEERYDRSQKILSPIDDELAQVLTMIILALIYVNAAYAEEAFELLQRTTAAHVLRHDESV
jgi:hypothetical protein